MQRAACLLLVFVALGCSRSGPPQASPPQLTIREYQTRAYETTDASMVVRALLNAFQDQGFTIKTANVDPGLIAATQEVSAGSSISAFHRALGAPDLKDCLLSECSSNVGPSGARVKVRVNCQMKLLKHGMAGEETGAIADPNFYRAFFEGVDKSVFIQRDRL